MKKNEIEYNLLIFDDEIEITKSLFQQVQKNYNIFWATNAKDALNILEKENIQVVLFDQKIKELNDFNLFNQIKQKYADALKLIIADYTNLEAIVGVGTIGLVFIYKSKPWNEIETRLAIEEAFNKYEIIFGSRKHLKTPEETNSLLEDKVKIQAEELENANQILQNLSLERNRFMRIVAHDLRNPIGAIESFSGLLKDGFNEFGLEDKLKFIGIINERSGVALKLIEGFLNSSKTEAGIFDLKMFNYDFKRFLEDTIALNKFKADEKSQSIFLKTPEEKIDLLFDREKMELVFTNIISNAIKFSPVEKNIWIDVTIQKDVVVTRITDEGQGMPENELVAIYSPYVTTSVKDTGGERSSGLGLAIAKKIIDAHKGEIFAESKPGKGSVFTVSLPNIKEL